MTSYLVNLWSVVTALLPILLVIVSLVLLAFILDAKMTDRKW